MKNRILTIRIPDVNILHCYNLLEESGADVKGMPMSTAITTFISGVLNQAAAQQLLTPYDEAGVDKALAAYLPKEKWAGNLTVGALMPLADTPLVQAQIEQPEEIKKTDEELISPFVEQAKAEVAAEFGQLDHKQEGDSDDEIIKTEQVALPPWTGATLASTGEIAHGELANEVKDLNDKVAVLALRFIYGSLPESLRDTVKARKIFNKTYLTFQDYLRNNPKVELPT